MDEVCDTVQEAVIKNVSNKKKCIFFKEMHVCPALNCLVFIKSDIELAMASDTLGSNPAAGPWRSHIASFHFYLCKQK